MNIVISIILTMAVVVLVVSAVLAISRIATGPSQLDRSLASDLLIAIVIAAIGLWAAASKQDTEALLLLMLSLLGFTGAVSVARMVGERVVYRPKSGEKQGGRRR